ncbi:hypothetical protein PL78_01855 [Yersinia entomophaga]|uniref:DUF1456 family protein n=1 Tax=Yersinia entomophaga TaxID=935293 RepID=A0ABM6BGQ1_YERET|nr:MULTISPECIES: DUF1456 family protein [Yersinia]ANI28581.1 hypothetical protein PL78_01855 [Yersinia entomophaga]OWF88433.1 hypothetical protein B4914_07190 [Yersinia entomophaga]
MINNDVLRSVRYMLNVNDAKIVEIIKLTDFEVNSADVVNFLKKEDEAGYQNCPDEVMAHFLNGLIFFKRGKDDKFPAPSIEARITNNIVLKKLRVAFELKDTDMHDIFTSVDFPVSKPELNALFRKDDSKNFRPCGDQVLRYFLKGLTLRVRGPKK